MNMKRVFIPMLCLLLVGCVSKSGVQTMIAEHHEEHVQPLVDQQAERIEFLEHQLKQARDLTDEQRVVLIRHFELLGELSADALEQLNSSDE